MAESKNVVVITGAGGMGSAIARRIGTGCTVILVDVNERFLDSEAKLLVETGYDVVPRVVDVSQRDSVEALAADAASRGPVTALVHTAGLSPVQASIEAIMRVDLLGTALMLDAFGGVISSGGAGVFVASMAGTMAVVDPDLELRLATTPTDLLLDLPDLAAGAIGDTATAYGVAKRANQVRVRAASLKWGKRGATLNAISPGIISTPMGRAELEGPNGDMMRAMIAGSATGRVGTPEDIAGAVEFLISTHGSFITGADLLVDGGVVASLMTPS